MKLVPPIKYHGGKFYLAKRIIALMPKHLTYVEPYFGGGNVLLKKDPEGISEIVNDCDGELMNFWITLAHESLFRKFLRHIEAIPFSYQAFQDAGVVYNGGECTPLMRAVRFFVRSRQSRQGLMKDFATLSINRTRRGMNEQVSSWLTAIEGLADVHARLKRVVMLNEDGCNVIKTTDSKRTLFYLDPTYLKSTRSAKEAYRYEMTDDQHQAMLDRLAKIKGKFILSGYRSKM